MWAENEIAETPWDTEVRLRVLAGQDEPDSRADLIRKYFDSRKPMRVCERDRHWQDAQPQASGAMSPRSLRRSRAR